MEAAGPHLERVLHCHSSCYNLGCSAAAVAAAQGHHKSTVGLSGVVYQIARNILGPLICDLWCRTYLVKWKLLSPTWKGHHTPIIIIWVVVLLLLLRAAISHLSVWVHILNFAEGMISSNHIMREAHTVEAHTWMLIPSSWCTLITLVEVPVAGRL